MTARSNRITSATTLAMFALVACDNGPPNCEDPLSCKGPPTWQIVAENLPGALLRVWGTSAGDVYAVGANRNDPKGALVLRSSTGDGVFQRVVPTTTTTGDLWWIDRVGDDDVRIVGEDGLVLRYRPSTGAFDARRAPTHATLFGAWGSSSNDTWYVGGDRSLQSGVIFRDDGTNIRLPGSTVTGTQGAMLFKVHGFSDGLWIVGYQGLAAFFDGQRFISRPTGTRVPLFTVHGPRSDRVWLVGGATDGIILLWDGQRFIDETPSGLPAMNGVWAVDDEEAYAAGFNGRIFHRTKEAGWTEIPDDPNYFDLHSVWVDDEGGVWAAGGQLFSDPPSKGVLVRYGPKLLNPSVQGL